MNTVRLHWFLGVLALVALSLSLGHSPVCAANHSGDITVNRTWSAANNPHNIVGNLRVLSGVTLTLQAGVQIVFQDGYSFEVLGTLRALGTTAQPILFSDEGNYYSPSVTFNGSDASGSIAQYCAFEYLYTSTSNANPTFENCSFRYLDSTSVSISGGSPVFSQCTFEGNYYGVSVSRGSPTFSGCMFVGNEGAGLYLYDASPIVENCDFTNNGQSNLEAAIMATADSFPSFPQPSTFSGNYFDGIGLSGTLTQNGTWDDTGNGIPWAIFGTFTIQSLEFQILNRISNSITKATGGEGQYR